ncbi:MAG: hypothetical protein ACT4QG_10440 [Sporichthyaceae bacterium]
MRTKHKATTAAAALVALAALGTAADAAEQRATFDYLGQFANVASAPPETGKIEGIASMVVTTRATTTGIDVTGLDPKATYIADVKEQPCFVEEGGKRFLFDPAGGQEPPNAIWVTPIEVEENGAALATVTSQRPAGPRAKSIVIHLLRGAGETKDKSPAPRLACADLPRVTS